MNAVRSVQLAGVWPPAAAPRPEAPAPAPSFRDLLLESIEQVNAMQQAADQAVEQLVTGQPITPAEVLTAVQKADIAFRLMMQIRNKIVQAYQEIQNIRV
ncbi:MAG: flagellar hook-basal body complex protein FliE [Thermoguttaceae bacterium]